MRSMRRPSQSSAPPLPTHGLSGRAASATAATDGHTYASPNAWGEGGSTRGLPGSAPSAAAATDGHTYVNIIVWGEGSTASATAATDGHVYASPNAWGEDSMGHHYYENEPAAGLDATPILNLEALHDVPSHSAAGPASGSHGHGVGSRGMLTQASRSREMANDPPPRPAASRLRTSGHVYGNVATVGDDDEDLPPVPPRTVMTASTPAVPPRPRAMSSVPGTTMPTARARAMSSVPSVHAARSVILASPSDPHNYEYVKDEPLVPPLPAWHRSMGAAAATTATDKLPQLEVRSSCRRLASSLPPPPPPPPPSPKELSGGGGGGSSFI